MHRTLPQETSPPVVAALLAGGSSRRMGADKSVALLGGRPLAHWAATALAAVSTYRIQVGGAPVPGVHWPVIADRRSGAGPAAGIESALLAFPGCSVAVCAVDCPFVAPGLLIECLDALDESHLAAVPRLAGRWHPLVAAYSPAFLPPLQSWLDSGRYDLQGLIATTPTAEMTLEQMAVFGDPATTLTNVNTAEQLESAAQWLDTIEHL